MKIFIICSKVFYGVIPPIRTSLENMGYKVFLPNCYDDIEIEARYKEAGKYAEFKAAMFRKSEETIKNVDSVLVINETKNGVDNYIGGATFLEMYEAFRLDKTIYLLNDIPCGILEDEIKGFSPIIINGDLKKIEEHTKSMENFRKEKLDEYYWINKLLDYINELITFSNFGVRKEVFYQQLARKLSASDGEKIKKEIVKSCSNCASMSCNIKEARMQDSICPDWSNNKLIGKELMKMRIKR